MKIENRPFWLFLLAYFVLLCVGLGSFPLIDWDENIYGAASKNMFTSADYLRIVVNGQLFTEKPPFYFWLASLFYSIFGIGEFATRLPSVLSGLFSFGVLYFFGKRVVSEKFGLLWALIYSSSLLPLLLSRTAYIDHLFNTFLLCSVLCLFLYDVEQKEKNRFGALKWLILASFSMGIGTLTKGPLGIAIPAFSFGAVRIVEKRFRFSFMHLLLCIALTLGVVSSYYLTDYLIHGEGFIAGFVEFQKKLLTKSLESHTGPWFYHGLVVLIGFFPWTPLLFGYALKPRTSVFENENTNTFAKILFVWAGIVLIIFSIVQTKLPHYSSSIYFPLSFFAAYPIQNGKRNRLLGWVAGYGGIIAFAFLLFPWIARLAIHSSDFRMNIGDGIDFRISILDYLPGLLILGSVLLSIYLLVRFVPKKENHLGFFSVLWIGMLTWIGTLSFTLAPKVMEVLQGRILKFSDIAEAEKGKLVFYKYLSFYPMFYRENKIHIIGSYKFKDEEKLLTEPEDQKLFLVANRNSLVELNFLYPKLIFTPIANEGDLFLIRTERRKL
ncbi:glycosyltransferase family 39 protein [Leptospira barantonii]|uniref:Glycosyltransferase family 39 protein n=1 Tax=Leptospira barantonii TaxID=2023184 RepID=A0A5F2AXM5_9LEPT|nr:glycosyltransferase family 39 protein [Leptospira barantonii]